MHNHNRVSARILIPVLLLVGIGIWVSSCSKKSTNPVSPINTGNPTVNGIVKDAGAVGNPVIAGATVQIVGTSTSATTDANGMFTLSVAPGVTKTINVTKTGYSLNEVVVNLAAGNTKNITVNLLQAGNTQTVAVSAGGSVTDTKSNAVLKLPTGFVTASGNVSVTVTGLDPTTEQIRALPGGLDAVDLSGNTKYLQPVSFAEYTVKDASGNVLQFNPSASSGANIELPIPVSLRGKPGYKNGDPIECYVYDPTDGKWKTPVPGVVGPSSVDATIPAIKATIFHLSWYGGAPALNQRACIKGYVKNSNGSAAVGANVDAYPGGTTTTDGTGFYDVDAAPSSNVRVVTSVLSGISISEAEIVVYTGASTDSCYIAPDLTLGLPQQGTFEVNATLYKSGSINSLIDIAFVSITLKTPAGATSNYDGASVQIGFGSQFTAVPYGSGSYMVYTGMPNATNFSLAAGQQYEIKIDFDKNGTIDATGFVRMVGVSTITYPADSATVPNHFTATWNDNGSANPGYSADYWLTIYGDSASRFFETTTTSKVVGNGSVDSSFYGSYLSNDPLPGGQYTMSVSSFNGPAGFLTVGNQLPNINGQNVTGYMYSYYASNPVTFNSSGLPSSAAPGYSYSAQHWKVPLALANFYKSIPSVIRKKGGISLPKR